MNGAIQQGRGKRIVCIDNDEVQGLTAKSILESIGHETTIFNDSVKAEEAILATPDAWDLVFTELWMPGLSGIDIANTILGLRHAMPYAIFMDRHLDPPDGSQASAHGHLVFAKPTTAQEFTALIRYICKKPRRH